MLRKLVGFLGFVKTHLAFLIPIALTLGLAKGHYYPMAYSRMICISALLIMIFPVFVNLDIWKGIRQIPDNKGVLILSSVINFIVYPSLAFGLGWIFLQNHPALWLGLIMLSLVPTSGMTINWTYFTKGNMHVAMGIVSIGILVSVLVLPFYIPFITKTLMGVHDIPVSREVILEKLFFVIILPIIFGTIARRLIVRFKGEDTFQRIKPINASISAFGVLVVSFLVMSLNSTQTMIRQFDIIWIALLPVVLFYVVMFLISHFIGAYFLGAEVMKPFFFGTAARYHVITLGVALGSFKDFDFVGGVVLMIAIGLAIQIPALAFYARWIQNNAVLPSE